MPPILDHLLIVKRENGRCLKKLIGLGIINGDNPENPYRFLLVSFCAYLIYVCCVKREKERKLICVEQFTKNFFNSNLECLVIFSSISP